MRKSLLTAVVGGLVLCVCAAVTAAAARLPVTSVGISAFQVTDVEISTAPSLTTSTVDAARDTFVDQRSPTSVNGSLGSLASTNGTKRVLVDGASRRVQNARPLIAFDLSSVCPTAEIVSATLEVTVTSGESRHLASLRLDVNASAWSEGDTTWRSAPDVDAVGRAPTVSDSGAMVSFDVTDTLVGPEGHLDQSSAAALHGWRISNGHSTVFASREATDATGPRLVLETGSC